jgi:EAL domain-containing protein (putative c-di-GMP-specific phosphodiesterase class I)
LSSEKVHDRDDLASLRAEWLQYRAQLHDPETGLPTLANVVDELRRTLEAGRSLAVFTVLLNAERQVEEVWGWQAYDRLVADFIRDIRENRGRRGIPEALLCVPAVRSDEIFLFVPLTAREGSNGGSALLEQQADEIDLYVRDFISDRFPAADRFTNFVGSSSIVFDPKVRVERIIYRGIREARNAVYERRARLEVHGAEVLRQIIAEGAITPVFQPIVDLSDRTIVAFEALSRGPAGSGFEDGEALFSFAERANLLLPLERTCRRRILEASLRIPPSKLLFLNLSRAAVSEPDFRKGAFEKYVRQMSFEPSRIVLEITERTYALHHETFTRILKELRREGFLIAVDDMGTGYSSLSSLAEIEPDFLKFDSVFVHEIHKHRIKRDLLDAMLSFARKAHTQVIAEGIEAPEELATLIELGVPYGQGFYLGRPDALSAYSSPS